MQLELLPLEYSYDMQVKIGIIGGSGFYQIEGLIRNRKLLILKHLLVNRVIHLICGRLDEQCCGLSYRDTV